MTPACSQYYQRLDKDGQRRGDKGTWQWSKVAHLEELKTAFRKAGVVVPLTCVHPDLLAQRDILTLSLINQAQ